MPGANLEAVRGVYERWAAGDFAASLEIFDPTVVFELPPEFPDSGTYRGTERVREYMRGFLEAWSRVAIEAEELRDAGDSVVAAVRQHGVGGGSGAETELRYFQVWTFSGDRVVRLENFRERAEAFAAVGLPG
jgi:ketosteroid isomerase-like protein